MLAIWRSSSLSRATPASALAASSALAKNVTFELELDRTQPFLPRDSVVELANLLDMERFEQGTTHWAVKDGSLPPLLLKTGFDVLPTPAPDAVADAYLKALDRNELYAERALRLTLAGLGDSLESHAARIRAGLEQAPSSASVEGPSPASSPAEVSLP